MSDQKERIPRIQPLTLDELGDNPTQSLWVQNNRLCGLVNLLFYKIEDLQELVTRKL